MVFGSQKSFYNRLTVDSKSEVFFRTFIVRLETAQLEIKNSYTVSDAGVTYSDEEDEGERRSSIVDVGQADTKAEDSLDLEECNLDDTDKSEIDSLDLDSIVDEESLNDGKDDVQQRDELASDTQGAIFFMYCL